MQKQFKTSLVFTLFFTVILGVVYPLLTGAIGYCLPSLERPSLLAQPLDGDGWFQGRPPESRKEMAHLNHAACHEVNLQYGYGASNLALTSPILWQQVKARIMAHKDFSRNILIPRELLFASASGYDPHISPQGALRQIPRIARLCHMDMALLKKLVDHNTQGKLLGFIGTDTVNVIELNRQLAQMPVLADE